MTARELLIERVNSIIKETAGINDELDAKISGVVSNVKNKLTKIKPKYDVDGLLQYSDTINIDINEKQFKINYIVVFFKDNKEYDEYINNYGNFNNGYFKLENYSYVKIFLIVINNKPDYNDFYDSLYHEIEHGFQENEMNNYFGGEELNAFIRTKMFSNNYFERILAEVIYGTRANEQDAMVNGMWGYVKHSVNDSDSFPDINKLIMDSEACLWLKKLYNNLNTIIKNKDNFEFLTALKDYRQFNINYSKLISVLKNGIKRFEKKIALVTRRVKTNFIREYHVHYKTAIKENKHNYDFYLLK